MILTALSLLSGFSIVLTAALIHFSVYWGFSERMKEEASVEIEFALAGIRAAGRSYLDTLSASPPRAAHPRITLIAPDGEVLFDNEYEALRMENHADRPEVRAARERRTGESERFSSTLEKQTYYRAALLDDGSVLRVAVSADSAAASALSLMPLILAIVFGIFIIAVIIASRITRRIVRPINALNLETPEENSVYDELSPLLLRIKTQNDQIKRQLEELRKQRLEEGAITDSMREGLLLLDAEGRIISCNRSALKLLGIDTPVTENRSALALRRDEPFRLALETVLAGRPAECVLQAGPSRLRLLASPVSDGGRLLGAALLLLDVTEQEDREKLRREFSANVSHELKTPLTVISGYAEILRDGLVKPEDAPDFGGKIYNEARRLLSLINDIMQLSRLDEGGENLERCPVNLLSVVNAVIERVSPLARSRNITVSVDCVDADGCGDEDEDAVISGIPQVLQEMVFNLLDNAIKYNRDGGTVTVSVTRSADTARLRVADTGAGIPVAERERVFERFYRIDKSRTGGGTGLGLSIVKHGARLHNAVIELEGNTPHGTIITLVFPAGE
jgi:two-component system phosphate regulon sensor histidine kinase PhoR